MPLLDLAVVLLLIVLNGFLAMSELALVSARRGRLRALARSGSRGAAVALVLVSDPTRFLSTVQIGITAVGIAAGAYSGATLAAPLAALLSGLPLPASLPLLPLSFALVVALITYLTLIVGELVPKRLALARAEEIAAAVAGPMALLARIATPLVALLRASTEAVLRLLGRQESERLAVTEEEVRALIAEGTEIGVFHAAERNLIEGVLRLADRPVGSTMTPRERVVWLDLDEPGESVRAKFAETGRSRFLVGAGSLDALRGMVLAKDLATRQLAGETTDLRACLRFPLEVRDSLPILRALELFRITGIHLAVVRDADGRVAGILTPTDVLQAIAGDLPEEDRAEEPPAVRRADGSWLMDGGLSLAETARLLHRPDLADAAGPATLAGFYRESLGGEPEIGAIAIHAGLRFEIVDMDGRRIDRLLVGEEER